MQYALDTSRFTNNSVSILKTKSFTFVSSKVVHFLVTLEVYFLVTSLVDFNVSSYEVDGLKYLNLYEYFKIVLIWVTK